MTRRTALLAVLIVVTFGVTGCSATNDSTPTPPNAAATQTATVEHATIIGVVSLKGKVVQQGAFQLHTQVAGTVSTVGPGSVTITPADGTAPVVVSPAVGDQFDAALVRVGDTTVPGMAIARATAAGFTVAADLTPAQLLRFTSAPLGARAQIEGTSAPFDCPLVDSIPTAAAIDSGSDQAPTLFCSIPLDTRVLAGMTASVVVELEKAENTLALPVEAVAGTIDSGTVYRRGNEGQAIETRVKLGTNDGRRIAILDGVKAGDVVLMPSPSLENRNG